MKEILISLAIALVLTLVLFWCTWKWVKKFWNPF